jgi:hypothetical protein
MNRYLDICSVNVFKWSNITHFTIVRCVNGFRNQVAHQLFFHKRYHRHHVLIEHRFWNRFESSVGLVKHLERQPKFEIVLACFHLILLHHSLRCECFTMGVSGAWMNCIQFEILKTKRFKIITATYMTIQIVTFNHVFRSYQSNCFVEVSLNGAADLRKMNFFYKLM